jgi:hypothetical protein
MPAAARRAYPRKVEIARVMAAARAGGLDVAGIEVSPDGTIRILRADAVPQAKNDLFAEWDDKL